MTLFDRNKGGFCNGMRQPKKNRLWTARHHVNFHPVRFVVGSIACSLSMGVALQTLQAAETKRPNILVILIDDMGWKDMGCAGSTYYETPHIDELAKTGMRFLNAYSPANVCTPSRGAIYSGKSPARTKLTTVFGKAGPDDRLHDKSKYQGEKNQNLEAMNRHVLPKDEVILAQAVVDGGYTTGFFGKWHCGECPGYYPDDRGFQVAKGYRTTYASTSKSGHWMKTFAKYGANMEGADPEAYLSDVLTDECIDFMTENQKKPWLAFLSHYLVHNPHQAKLEKVKYYADKAKTDQGNPKYAAMIESVDESVGRVIQTLKELNLEDDTLVIFTSDNGGLSSATSNYPLLGGKSTPFEGGLKVPFIAKWPGKIKPSVSEQRIIGMDIYPTILSAAGLPLRPKQHVDGVNLMPVLTQNKPLKPRSLLFHFPHYTSFTGPFTAIIDNDWRLIRFYNDIKGSPYLLYNLKNDPGEQHNLAKENPEVQQRLKRQMDHALLEMDAEMPTPNPDYVLGLTNKDYDAEYALKKALRRRRSYESRLKK